MDMINVDDFEKIRPYHDHEINTALRRITEAPVFAEVARFVFPDKTVEEIKTLLHGIHSADDFQVKFMHRAVRRVVETSSDGLSYQGFENLNPKKAYLFIANHRDIVLDSAILQILLVEHNIPTSEITFGSNLMISPFITDFGKVNKLFTAFRGGTKLELINNTKLLSAYIRYTITKKHHSAWIAQRNGRTKDGFDKTEDALLKMLNISGSKDFKSNFSELNIVPLTISYEYEPCGTLKVNELYQSSITEYKKSSGEDLNSIITGFLQPKGRIHLCAGSCINTDLAFDIHKSNNENIKMLAKLIDDNIYKNYKLWKTNYISYDLLHGTSEFKQYYSEIDKNNFINFIDREINKLKWDKSILQELYLRIYSTPLENFSGRGKLPQFSVNS